MNDVEEKEKNTEKGGNTVASFAFLQKKVTAQSREGNDAMHS